MAAHASNYVAAATDPKALFSYLFISVLIFPFSLLSKIFCYFIFPAESLLSRRDVDV